MYCKNCRYENTSNAMYCAKCSIPLNETRIDGPKRMCFQSSNGKIFPLSNPRYIIGRKGSMAFPTDKFMSREHAKIKNNSGTITVQDMGSQNGTFINGKQLNQVHELRNGDKIKCGNTELLFKSN